MSAPGVPAEPEHRPPVSEPTSARWAHVLAVLRRRNPTARPVPRDAIAQAEARLGLPLPRGFVRLVSEVGPCDWPRIIFGPEALVREEGIAARPAWLVAFATDGGGNDDCFDVRVPAPELPIVFWDHEHPPRLATLGGPASEEEFLGWLEEAIGAAVAYERREGRAELTRRVSAEMERLVPVAARGFSPSSEEVAAAARELGWRAPEPWRYFLATFGCWEQPVRFLAPAELVVEHGRLVLARSMDEETSYCFEREATVVAVPGGERWAGFEPWLLAMLERASIAAQAAADLRTWAKGPGVRRRTRNPGAEP